ncbi:MAG: hypothetical protein KIS73_08985 [Enhydrobacter sp.]|nr:hypothetical protein [Enhydrobacter sp.]
MIRFAAMNPATHDGLYRNTPLVLGGLLGALALLICGIAAAVHIASTGDELLPLLFAVLGAFVLMFIACMLAALRRHRWIVEADSVRIEERPLVPLTGRRRFRRVPFGDIASLSLVQNSADELLAITTGNGERFVLPPVLRPGKGLIRWPDQMQLDAFAATLRAAMAAAGHEPPPVVEGMGFWNRPAGLALLSLAFLASLALAAVTLWGMWEGATTRHRGGEAAAIMVMLPVGVGWMLRRSWQRRRSVLRAAKSGFPVGQR